MAEIKKTKILKKEFFEVKVPLTSAKVYLYGSSVESLVNRVVSLDLTRNLRGKSLVLKLKVLLDGKELIGEPLSLELTGSYIRRMIRKGIDYVEDSFAAECKDFKVIVKPFLITRNKVSRAVRRELRNRAKEHIISRLNGMSVKDVFNELMTNKFQKELSFKLKKLYPLALCEIRMFEIIEEKKQL